MVEIRDVRPLGQIWHKRPNEKIEKSEDKASSDQKHSDKNTDKDDEDDDGSHVDEYA